MALQDVKQIVRNDTRKLLIFGGSPVRMQEVKQLLAQVEDLEIVGAYSDQEGLEILGSGDSIHMILIGGRYNSSQRKRIRQAANGQLITEPGVDYPYSNENIFLHVDRMMSSLYQD